MKRIILLLSMCFLIGELAARELNKAFQLLPQPQSIELTEGKGINYLELSYIQPIDQASIPPLGDMLNRLPHFSRVGKPVRLQLIDQHVPSSPEGYTMEINSQGVCISARTMTGIFYGCQTLEQLMEDSRDFNLPIPAMQITDYPAISYRAVHFDVKHHLDRIEYYYREIDKLAQYKINAIIWELEDKLRYTRRPEIGAPNAISKQEMQAICRYAKERNIEISPLVQGLGHACFILKHHWELRENPNSDWEFCPSDPRTYDLQFDLYRDAIEAMPYGKYLHVGGDEITAIGIDQRCKATGKTPFELQMTWLKKVCDFATAHDRIPIFWDDMPLKYGGVWNLINSTENNEEIAAKWNDKKLNESIELFPKECVYMRWNYRDATKPGHQRILQWYHDKGLKVMGATAAAYGDSPFIPRENSLAGYIKGFSELVAQNHLEGILATAWDDGSPHSETVWRGYIAQGEYGWNPTARSVEAFKVAHAQREFGFPPNDNRMNFLDELEQEAFFFDDALVNSGRRNPAWGTTDFTLITLPSQNEPGTWSRTYQSKIAQAKIEQKRYEKICQGIKEAKQHALRNRYTLEIYEQTNHLFNFPTRLILALHEYDTAKHEKDKQTALQQINEVCDYFSTMRNQLEEVYSQTRFMEQPDGYIADQNHHNHLAAKSNNSDWWYYYEIPMVRKTRAWINSLIVPHKSDH